MKIIQVDLVSLRCGVKRCCSGAQWTLFNSWVVIHSSQHSHPLAIQTTVCTWDRWVCGKLLGVSVYNIRSFSPYTIGKKSRVVFHLLFTHTHTHRDILYYHFKFSHLSLVCVCVWNMIANRARVTLKFSHPIDWSQVYPNTFSSLFSRFYNKMKELQCVVVPVE